MLKNSLVLRNRHPKSHLNKACSTIYTTRFRYPIYTTRLRYVIASIQIKGRSGKQRASGQRYAYLRRRTSARLRGRRRICPNSPRGAVRKTQKIPAVKSASTAANANASDLVKAGRAPASSGLPFLAAGESSLPGPAPAPAASMSRRANGMAMPATAAAAAGRGTRCGGSACYCCCC